MSYAVILNDAFQRSIRASGEDMKRLTPKITFSDRDYGDNVKTCWYHFISIILFSYLNHFVLLYQSFCTLISMILYSYNNDFVLLYQSFCTLISMILYSYNNLFILLYQ